MTTIAGTHNLQILRGLSKNNSLLSCKPDSSKVDLFCCQDDGTGRQRCDFKLVEGNDIYLIVNYKRY